MPHSGAIAAPTRRGFLSGVGLGLSGIVLSQAFTFEAKAYQYALEAGLQALNHTQAYVIEAIAARIWPGDDTDPGAREAGAVYYIDRALAGPYAKHMTTYREAVNKLNAFVRAHYDNDSFDFLDEAQQDEILAKMEKGEIEGFPEAKSFFSLVRTHVMEGVFADPIYGGNRDFAGWKAVGYPGAYYLWTEEEQLSFEPLDKPYQSVADL